MLAYWTYLWVMLNIKCCEYGPDLDGSTWKGKNITLTTFTNRIKTVFLLGNGGIRLGINYSVANEMKRDE
jgi:hypothetical protein